MKGVGAPEWGLRMGSAFALTAILAVAVLVGFIPRPWINPTLFQGGLFALLGVWGVRMAVRPYAIEWSQAAIPLLAAVVWGVVQVAGHYTYGAWDTKMAVMVWAGNLTVFLLTVQICGSGRVRERLLGMLVYFSFGLSVVSVVQYFDWNGSVYWLFPIYDSAVLGPFVNRDHYAAFIELTLPIALWMALRGGPQALRFGVMGAAMYASVIAGASRAGALLTTAELVVVPLAVWMRGRREEGGLRLAALNVWLVAGVFVGVVGWTVIWARFQDPDPLRGRREMLRDTVEMIQARPYLGVGLGNFRAAYPAFGSVDFGSVVNHAHNDWAEWAADGGIGFSLLMVWIAVWSVPKAWKTVWGIGVVAVFVHSGVDFPLQKPVLELWTFCLLGAMAAETSKREGRRERAY